MPTHRVNLCPIHSNRNDARKHDKRRYWSSAVAVWHVLADSPVISCAHTAARVNQRNAFIACEVRSQPAVSVLYWVIDHNATTLVVGQILREYWTLVLVSRRFTPSL